MVRGPIIIDARTLNAHPTILSQPPAPDHHHHHHHHHQPNPTSVTTLREQTSSVIAGWPVQSHQQHQQQQPPAQWCSSCAHSKSSVVGVANSGAPAAQLNVSHSSGPGTVVGCLLGVYPGSAQSSSSSSSQCTAGPRAAPSSHILHQAIPQPAAAQPTGGPIVLPSAPSGAGCRACCCHHHHHHHHQQQPTTAVQLTSQRGGISLRVARVASTTSVRAAPYAHSQHQGLGTECR